MDYIIVMPAFNEEENIETTIQTLIDQSKQPKRLIVVDDGSTDRTPNIVEKLAKEHPWVYLVRNNIEAEYLPGAKIVRAFYHGFKTIDTSYDVVVKLDADLVLPP